MRLFSLVCFCLCGIISFAQDFHTYDYDGLERQYFLYIPDGVQENAPLVFVLHGYTSSAQTIMNYCEMNEQADLHGFVACYPQGSTDFAFTNHWNSNLTISTTDDIGFLSELAGYLQGEYELNPEHTFSCGMSNGGFMSYTLACERPDVFKAIASVTGTMSGYDWNNCDPSEVVPVFQISGVDDQVVPIDGSMTTFGGWGGAPGMDSVTTYWQNANQCLSTDVQTIPGPLNTEATYHTDGIDGQEVWQFLIESWPHAWPVSQSQTGFTAAEKIWEFFEKVISRTTATEQNYVDKTLELYPNPVFDQLSVRAFQTLENCQYQILSSSGQVYQKGSACQTIDVSNLNDGLYFLNIEGQVMKFVKARM